MLHIEYADKSTWEFEAACPRALEFSVEPADYRELSSNIKPGGGPLPPMGSLNRVTLGFKASRDPGCLVTTRTMESTSPPEKLAMIRALADAWHAEHHDDNQPDDEYQFDNAAHEILAILDRP